MVYLIGTDEAGYGPNLGPLVISATAWRVPDEADAEDLYARLEHVIVAEPKVAKQRADECLVMADSKALYKPGKGLRQLERGLLAALALTGHRPRSWWDVFEALAPDVVSHLRTIPWYAPYDVPVPRQIDPDDQQPVIDRLRDGLSKAGVELLGMRSRAIFPGQFNQLVDHHGSKGTALSHATLALAAEMMEPLGQGPILVLCDKHGGRNRYTGLLMEHFPQWLMEVQDEGRRQSVYRFGPAERRVEFRFQAQGEAHLPTALASMASKYLRELAMEALNAFWRHHIPDLKPTAGYPQDARRFKAQIADVQAELQIDDHILWRNR